MVNQDVTSLPPQEESGATRITTQAHTNPRQQAVGRHKVPVEDKGKQASASCEVAVTKDSGDRAADRPDRILHRVAPSELKALGPSKLKPKRLRSVSDTDPNDVTAPC